MKLVVIFNCVLRFVEPNYSKKNNIFEFYKNEKYIKKFVRINFEYFNIYRLKKNILT